MYLYIKLCSTLAFQQILQCTHNYFLYCLNGITKPISCLIWKTFKCSLDLKCLIRGTHFKEINYYQINVIEILKSPLILLTEMGKKNVSTWESWIESENRRIFKVFFHAEEEHL